jgi:chromosome segregation ATPase
MTDTGNDQDLKARLAEKKKVEESLADVRGKLSSEQLATSTISRISQRAGDLRTRVESLKSREKSLDARQRSELEQLQIELGSVVEIAANAKAERARLEAEEGRLKADLADYAYICSEEELRDCMRKLQGVQADMETLKKAIQHQEEVIAESKSEMPDFASLKSRREGLLADLAMGSGEQKAFDAVEKEIAKATKEKASCEALVKQAEAAIIGLRKRLIAASAQAETLQAEAQEAACHYLINRASLINEEYSEAAARLAGLFSQIVAIGELLNTTSKGSYAGTVTPYRAHKLFIPAVKVGQAAAQAPGEALFSRDDIDLSKAVNEERARIQAMGLSFS